MPQRLIQLTSAAAIAAVSLSSLSVSPAHAQAQLAFTGGSGAPLGITLLAPVTYNITVTPTQEALFFVFDEVGNVLGTSNLFTGTWTFSVNGGGPQALTLVNSNFSGGSFTPNDLYIFEAFFPLTAGDIVTLNSASVTTSVNVANPRPADGAYRTFISQNTVSGQTTPSIISANGVSVVPEASTFALALPILGVVGAVVIAKRRKK